MQKINETLNKIPFLNVKQFFDLCRISYNLWGQLSRENLITYKKCPINILEAAHSGVKVYYDLLLDILEKPESMLKHKKHFNAKKLLFAMEEGKIDFYLDLLDELDSYINSMLENSDFNPIPYKFDNEQDEMSLNDFRALQILPRVIEEAQPQNNSSLPKIQSLKSKFDLASIPENISLKKSREISHQNTSVKKSLNERIASFLRRK